MKRDVHDETREWIALGQDLSEAQQSSLQVHLAQCEACRAYVDATNRVIRSLRAVPLAADARLVRATQMRVRFHASRLRETRQRMWFVAIACLGVGLSATLTVPWMWRLFEWIGESAGLPALVWQSGFVFFFITPALVVGVSLAVRGTRFTDDAER